MITITNILDAESYIEAGEAVIFDLDDTLYGEKQYVRSGYARIEEAFGIPGLAAQFWQAFEEGMPAIDTVLARHDLLARKEEALQIYRLQEPEITLYPGVRSMLERLHRAHQLGRITDGRPQGQRAKIKALGIGSLFDQIIITDELGGVQYRKPNPTAFQLILEALGAKKSRPLAVYIGDNIHKDFIAPQALGMRCIYFRNPDGLYS